MVSDDRVEATENLRRIEEYRHTFRQRTQLNDRFVYVILAATYLLGFGGQYVVTLVSPALAEKSSFVVAVVGSLALFIILAHSYKQYKGVRGSASLKPTYFGVSWLIGLVVTLAATILISAQFPDLEVMHVAYATSCMLIGVIYACGGIFLSSRRELFLGCWLIGVGVASSMLNMPLMLLTIAVLSAVGFLICAARPSNASSKGL
ncbi:MAG: hypothetical protein ACK5LN_01480 [Propioniciclava sp.]